MAQNEILDQLITDYQSGHLNANFLADAVNNCAEANAVAVVNQCKEWMIIIGLGVLVLAQTQPAQQVIQSAVTATQQTISGIGGNNAVNTKLDAAKIVAFMQQKGYVVRTAPGAVNIVYLQNPNLLGTIDQWSDRRLVIQFDGTTPKITHDGAATTKPGSPTFNSPKNAQGAPLIQPGQYKAWQVGTHIGASGNGGHEALIQVAPVLLARSLDGGKSFKPSKFENTGINQHWGYDMSAVRNASEGCLVEQSKEGHRQFMRVIKGDPDYIKNPGYIFQSTFINWGELQ